MDDLRTPLNNVNKISQSPPGGWLQFSAIYVIYSYLLGSSRSSYLCIKFIIYVKDKGQQFDPSRLQLNILDHILIPVPLSPTGDSIFLLVHRSRQQADLHPAGRHAGEAPQTEPKALPPWALLEITRVRILEEEGSLRIQGKAASNILGLHFV